MTWDEAEQTVRGARRVRLDAAKTGAMQKHPLDHERRVRLGSIVYILLGAAIIDGLVWYALVQGWPR